MIKLVAVDLDGTLLSSDKKLPRELPEILQLLQERNIVFVIASGRQYANVHALFEPLEHRLGTSFLYIAENGALVVASGRSLYVDALPHELMWEPLETIRGIGKAWAVVCGEKSAYIEDNDPELIANARMYYRRLEHVPDVFAASAEDRVCKLAVYDSAGGADNSYPALRRYEDRFQLCLSGRNWVDLLQPGVTKGKALGFVQKTLGIRQEESMAFGDYMNDMDMMSRVFYSYAMENAFPGLKRVCRFVCESNDDNGVVKTLRRVLELN